MKLLSHRFMVENRHSKEWEFRHILSKKLKEARVIINDQYHKDHFIVLWYGSF